MRKGRKGFTLVEILIVLAVLGILGAVVVPNVLGFVSRGKERSWAADQRTLQAAADAYYADPKNIPTSGDNRGKHIFPTDSGKGLDAPDNATALVTTDDSYINLQKLLDGKYIDAAVASADVRNLTANTGSYKWFIDVAGKVKAQLAADATKFGYQDGIYP